MRPIFVRRCRRDRPHESGTACDSRLSPCRRQTDCFALEQMVAAGRLLLDQSLPIRRCAQNNFCSGSVGRCLINPPVVPILLPTTTICSSI
ncbi:hypothetical protein AVEN_60253-1 [Araneus ventricosus]|uniref:Uncharacterized protein n=1 Tax=Araneus ventricosus TaxID=182803 RepID=A0A4Y2D0W3_ARAVE|nr:hypothetical protein AVEN_60253-1 [Araneus ventricosus]